MPLPEPSLDLLIEQLRALAPADRRAVLARLDARDRQMIGARLREARHPAPVPAAPETQLSPYSKDIAERIAAVGEAGGGSITPKARAALARAMALRDGAEVHSRGGSLFDAARVWLGRGRTAA